MSANNSPERTSLTIGTALRDSRMQMSQERQSTSVSQEGSPSLGLRREFERITDSTTYIIRTVESLTDNEFYDKDIDVNVVLNDIEREEDLIFSPIPEYLQYEWNRMASENASARKEAAMKVDADEKLHHKTRELDIRNGNTRMTIDPSVPLYMPFSKERYQASSQRKSMPGHYHSLFFGGEPVVFAPPEQNKRKEIEKRNAERALLKKKMQHTPRPEVTPSKKTLKVGKDFVPACAQVDNSLAQKKLQEKQEKQEMEKNKLMKRATPRTKTTEPEK